LLSLPLSSSSSLVSSGKHLFAKNCKLSCNTPQHNTIAIDHGWVSHHHDHHSHDISMHSELFEVAWQKLNAQGFTSTNTLSINGTMTKDDATSPIDGYALSQLLFCHQVKKVGDTCPSRCTIFSATRRNNSHASTPRWRLRFKVNRSEFLQ
jgi:hypothetical protein